MKKAAIILYLIYVSLLVSTLHAQLQVDFNSTSQDGGPHPQAGFESYDAGHEVAADFNTKTYGSITVTPAWPNTTDNRVQQMLDRGAGNDDNWVNDAIMKAHKCLCSEYIPDSSKDCDYCAYRDAVKKVLL